MRERIARAGRLTAAERTVTDTLTQNYPASGLLSITQLAKEAGVSAPTVARTVKKLGFDGFAAFHAALVAEVEARAKNPIEKRARWAHDAPEHHVLNRLTAQVSHNIAQTLSAVDPAAFDAAKALLADPARRLHIVGGRITQSLAQYFFTHMEVIRPNVALLSALPATFAHALVDMGNDTLVVFDIRRYEESLERLATLAVERGAAVILLTDQWGSPVETVARHTFRARVEIPSAWDSNVATLVLTEALIAAVGDADWPGTAQRYDRLETLMDAARIFSRRS
ncbi:MAG: MurR/RpiR family transcriptional regulator [Pseudomonadota bacterium]